MTDNSRRILLSVLVILLAACACVGLLAATGAGFFILNPARTVTNSAVTTSTTAPIPPATATHPTGQTPVASPTAGLPGTSLEPTATASQTGISADVAAQMDQIQQQVIQLRGLPEKQPVKRALISTDQLRQHVVNDFLNQYSEQDAKNDVIVLSTFGLLNPDFDLRTFMINLLSEQIAGFYDNKTKEMYVVQGEGFNGLERFVYAHEFDHALQDQNYNIEKGLNYSDQVCKTQSEHCASVQALLEGDATILQLEWLSRDGTAKDVQDIQQSAQNTNSPVYDSAPPYLRDDFVFPYQQGRDFVQSLYNRGGWAAVDQAYKNLPASTEQILHPDKYPNDKPVTVNLPDTGSILGTGWRKVKQDTMGEWYTYLIFADGIQPSYRLDSNQATNSTSGWGGDTYEVFYNDQTRQVVMVIQYVWDSKTNASQYASAFRQYGTARFGNPSSIQGNDIAWDSQGSHNEFHLSGDKTTWILAPDAATAQKLWQAVQHP